MAGKMKHNKEAIRGFALHLLKEHGYNKEVWNEDDIKSFVSEKFGVKWVGPKYNAKCGATFKPNENKVTEYGIYAKNFEALCESVMWQIHNGYWKKE